MTSEKTLIKMMAKRTEDLRQALQEPATFAHRIEWEPSLPALLQLRIELRADAESLDPKRVMRIVWRTLELGKISTAAGHDPRGSGCCYRDYRIDGSGIHWGIMIGTTTPGEWLKLGEFFRRSDLSESIVNQGFALWAVQSVQGA